MSPARARRGRCACAWPTSASWGATSASTPPRSTRSPASRSSPRAARAACSTTSAPAGRSARRGTSRRSCAWARTSASSPRPRPTMPPPPTCASGRGRAWCRRGRSASSAPPDRTRPCRGSRFAFALESGFGDYEFAKAVLSFGAWRLLTERHVLGFRLGAGIILGRSPRFDQFYVGDVNPLQPPRPLDLAVSTRGSFDVFSTGADKVVTGDVYGGVSIEYAFQLFRNPRTIYGGDLFVSVGTYGLGSRVPFSAPVDLTFNVGLRLDTFIGVFELSLGNALGRLP